MKTTLVPVESLIDYNLAPNLWLDDITKNKTFWQQLERRKELLNHFDSVANRPRRPDMSMRIAVNHGYVSELQAIELYTSLSDLLEYNNEYKRIILYLPFEFLPCTSWQPHEIRLNQVLNRFRKAYMKAWKDMLLMHDVRANFVDGDILESDQLLNTLPRVVKAAHLIPKLIENGFIVIKDVFKLIEENKDQVLRDSIADTLPVLADQGVISEKELKYMEESKDWLIIAMARIIKLAKTEAIELVSDQRTFASVQEDLANEFRRIDTENYRNITERRKAWLKQTKKEKAINISAEIISTMIIDESITDEVLITLLDCDIPFENKQAVIEGIQKTIESMALANSNMTLEKYEKYQEILSKLWESDSPAIKEILHKIFCRLYHLKIISNSQMNSKGIIVPKLTGPFSMNTSLFKEELTDIEKAIILIESRAEISQFIYPVVMIFGSRLKGYGKHDSDIDLGIFVRPEISVDDRKNLHAILDKIFIQENIHYGIAEFWLEKDKNIFKIRNIDGTDPSFGESHWTHVLFGSIWMGKEETVHELLKKILVPYLYTDKTIDSLNKKRLHLEELERDNLQYRLMHKGYKQFFPQYGGINTKHADQIDGTSTFWDSGYRQIATRLFISRVFLPTIAV